VQFCVPEQPVQDRGRKLVDLNCPDRCAGGMHANDSGARVLEILCNVECNKGLVLEDEDVLPD